MSALACPSPLPPRASPPAPPVAEPDRRGHITTVSKTGDVMAEEKNLLLRRPFLTPEHCKTIKFAWAHAPSRYVTNHIGGRPAVIREVGLLPRKDVMDALCEV